MKLKPDEIKSNRAAGLASYVNTWTNSYVCPGNTTQQQATLNIAQPTSFCIVSWNIQTFHDSKVNANPWVNWFIRKVIDEIECDLCILLETRLGPASVYSAVEHSLRNPSNHNWNTEEDEQEETFEETTQRVEAAAQGGYTFTGLETDQTGKTPALPDEIRFYIKQTRAQRKNDTFVRLGKEFCVADESGLLNWKNFYTVQKVSSLATDPSTSGFTSAVNLNMVEVPTVFKAIYAIEADSNPNVELTDTQIQSIDETVQPNLHFVSRVCMTCGFPFTHPINPANTCVDCVPQKRFLPEMAAMLVKVGCFSPDLETYSALFRTHEQNGSSLDPIIAFRKAVNLVPANTRLVFADVNGFDAGFQDAENQLRNFRCPFMAPINITLPDGTELTDVPILASHGPFEGGQKARTAMLRNMLNLHVMNEPSTTGGTNAVALCNAPNAIVMGDFNIEYKASGNSAAAKVFATYASAEFVHQSGTEKTSLSSTYKKGTKQLSLKYSNNYDHVMVKGNALNHNMLQCGAIDAVGYLADLLTNNEVTFTPEDEEDQEVLTNYSGNADAVAWYVYHKYISDHIPVFIDFVVKAIPSNAPSVLTQNVGQPASPGEASRVGVLVIGTISNAQVLRGINHTHSLHSITNTHKFVGVVVKMAEDFCVVETYNSQNKRQLLVFARSLWGEQLKYGQSVEMLVELTGQEMTLDLKTLFPIYEYKMLTASDVINVKLGLVEDSMFEHDAHNRCWNVSGKWFFFSRLKQCAYVLALENLLVEIPYNIYNAAQRPDIGDRVRLSFQEDGSGFHPTLFRPFK